MNELENVTKNYELELGGMTEWGLHNRYVGVSLHHRLHTRHSGW